MTFENQLLNLIQKSVKDLYKSVPDGFVVEHPENEDFGDYAVNVALVLSKTLKKPPMEIANEIVAHIKENIKDTPFEKVEAQAPGFINFTISKKHLIHALKSIPKDDGFGRGNALKGRKMMVEYTDPNPFKVFHIGHLMTNCIGEALSRLFQFQGADVKRANYQGDVGLHVAKAIWGLRRKMEVEKMTLADLGKLSLNDKAVFMGRAYSLGAEAYEEDEAVCGEIEKLNVDIYSKDESVVELYDKGRQWSLDYFETLYERLGTKFDYYYFESGAADGALRISEDMVRKGVFEEDDDAVVFRGEKYGLHTRVFVNSLGLPTYESKDLGLAKSKYSDFKYDESIIITANEIDEYFKVVLKAMEFAYPELASKTKHMSHGMMKFKSGKMSSRTGKIVAGDVLLNEIRQIVLDKMDDKDMAIADSIAVAAIKYTILKNGIGSNIIYDEESSLSMTGDTGPYLQYTNARINSVLKAVGGFKESDVNFMNLDLNNDETSLLHTLYKFPEVVKEAAGKYAPNRVCTYLNLVARKFNTFYGRNRIKDAESADLREFRLLLSAAVGRVLKNGLNVLGINAPERM